MWAAAAVLALLLDSPPVGAYTPEPAIHYTPPPWRNTLKDGGGGGDMAGALLHPVTKIWHVMPLSHISWAHISSADMVSWTYHGNGSEPPAQGGGPRFESGGMIYDHQRNLTVAFADTPTTASVSRSPDLAFGSWQKPTTLYSTTDPLNTGKNGTQELGCWDPIMWWDERSSLYYAANACGHCDPGDTPAEHGAHIDCSGGEGLQLYYSAPKITGPWQKLGVDFLEEKMAYVPRVGSWPRPHEFVTPDYYPLPSADGGSSGKFGFLTTSYGDMRWTGLPGSNTSRNAGLCYDYANYYTGDRPAPGAPFEPSLATSAPFDWSPFTPVNDTASPNLTFAVSKGMMQFGCCPKTAGPEDGGRRVMFGMVANGENQGGRTLMKAPNFTMSLPRDLSVTPDGLLRQRFIPELEKLRVGSSHVHVGEQPLAPGGIPKAAFAKGAVGRQLEIRARFEVDASVRHKFGLLVLANPSLNEYTSITFDPAREHVLLDRRQSGAGIDADVRGGPWPGAAATGEATLHVYVDQAVVELIAVSSATEGTTTASGAPMIESTAIAAWVQPTSAASDGVALWSDSAAGVKLMSLDVWQLELPTHRVDAPSGSVE
jgi:sucrose-6-phosphate hydrolase SacC (GH32 family)